MIFHNARPLMEILTKTIEEPEPLHPLLPAGFTLLAAPAKAGKSLLAEQITLDVSLQHPVLYLALEYNELVARRRFARFGPGHDVHLVLRGQIERLNKKSAKELRDMLEGTEAKLLIIDVLTLLKSANIGSYDQEYDAVMQIKDIADQARVDCLALHHTKKLGPHTEIDPFELILGSTALQGVPDNLMVMERKGNLTHLHRRGRLIEDQTNYLEYCDGEYLFADAEKHEQQNLPAAEAAVLRMLKEGPMRVRQIAASIDRDESQISKVCQKLFEKGTITRENKRGPYQLVGRDDFY